MCFARLDFSSSQMAPQPPLSEPTFRPSNPKTLEKRGVAQFFSFFTRLDLLSTDALFFDSFSSDSFLSLTLLTTVVASVRKSEIWLLNFLRPLKLGIHNKHAFAFQLSHCLGISFEVIQNSAFPVDFPRKNRDLEKGWRLCRTCGARKVTDIHRFVRFVRFVIQMRHSLPVSFLGCLDHESPSFTMVSPGIGSSLIFKICKSPTAHFHSFSASQNWV